MRTLYLTRHAKSSWDDPRTADFDRPLNTRGERDAPFMARLFADRNEPVDRLVSSPANRAFTTALCFADALGVAHQQVQREKAIYLAPPEILLHLVNLLPDDLHRVMLFGHNPGFSELVDQLSGRDLGEMPTCATVRIDLPVHHWGDVSNGLGDMVWFDYPKRYPEVV